MADKRIQDLTPATSVESTDRFVLEQSGQAKSLTGALLVSELAEALDGHGGIADIEYTAPVSGSVVGTLSIYLADDINRENPVVFSVTNGRGITDITWVNTGTSGDGMTHTGTFSYNDGTTSSVQIRDGVKGNTGAQTYVWFKWAQVMPSSNADMQNNVGPYIGICATTASSAPSSYTSYTWYQYKGDKGDTGDALESIELTSTSGLVDTYTIYITGHVSVGTFTVVNAKSIVSVTLTSGTHAAGSTDVYTITFNDGDTSTFSVYNGANGLGSVSTVSGIQADGVGNVAQVISGSGAPTTSTTGQTNQLYYDTSNSVLYYCVGESSGSYIWQGAGVTVDTSLSSSSTNPVQNKVITARIGLGTLPGSATDLTGAINAVNSNIPAASSTTPSADTAGGAVGTGTTWARSNHQHPLNVATSGTPADLGNASLGSAATYARTDHIHKMPTASDVGAVSSAALVDLVYPVGSIYMSVNNVSPETFLGGEWDQIEDTFLLAAGSNYIAGSVGGSANHTHTTGNHTLTVSEMPAHYHNPNSTDHTMFAIATAGDGGIIGRTTVASGSGAANVLKSTNNVARTYNTSNTGGGGAHNHGNTGSSSNMPPYLAVYMWKRIA